MRLPEFEVEKRREWQDFPGIFKNTNIGREDLDPTMLRYAQNNDILLQPRRMLISSHYGERMLLATPLLK